MTEKRPTICAECAHVEMGWSGYLNECHADLVMEEPARISFVTGRRVPAVFRKRVQGRCFLNKGNCEHFTPKPRPWWRRLFS